MIFKSHVFDEPLLEFGDGGQHFDPRQGLREFGPLQPRSGDVVRVGVIGTDETVAGFTEFLAETARGIESENKQLINLNPDFPGLGNQNPFRCKFEVPDGATATLSRRQVNEIREIGRHDKAVRHAVELITAHLSALMESSAKPDVIVLALPVPLIEKLVNAKSEDQVEGTEDEDDGDETLNFRDLLKAKTLHLPVPTQIVWPDTWDNAAKISEKGQARKQSPDSRSRRHAPGISSMRSSTRPARCHGGCCPTKPNIGQAFLASGSTATSTGSSCGRARRRCSTSGAVASFCAEPVRRQKPKGGIRTSLQKMRTSWLGSRSRRTRRTIGTYLRV